MPTDAELIERCNSADAATAERAFAMLYERHKGFVLKVANSIVRDHGLALDALQETFTYMLRQFPPSGNGLKLTAKLTTYLYPIARNAAISQLRKARRLPNDEVNPDELPGPMFADDSDIHAVLRELPANGREVITLRFIHDFSLNEIADALDLPLGTVKSRLHSAITQLRNSPKIRHFFDL